MSIEVARLQNIGPPTRVAAPLRPWEEAKGEPHSKGGAMRDDRYPALLDEVITFKELARDPYPIYTRPLRDAPGLRLAAARPTRTNIMSPIPSGRLPDTTSPNRARGDFRRFGTRGPRHLPVMHN